MKYNSDLIQQIITSDVARKILDEVAPIYADSFVGLWLFQVIGSQLDEMSRWTNEYYLQIVPQTATWTLDLWEDEFNISRDPLMSTEKRRERIISNMRDRAPMNPYVLARLASVATANAEVEIEENTGKNKFTVFISAMPTTTDERKIRAAIDRAKQGHLYYDIKYIQYATGTMAFGGIMQPSYAITMEQVN